MKINVIIKENPVLGEDEVVIECKKVTEEIKSAADSLSYAGSTVIGKSDGRKFVVQLSKILYFESVDKNSFFYTSDCVYHTALRLYEVEEKFRSQHFIRVSKAMVVNILKIVEIDPYLAGKLRLRLTNGEFIIVSRQYAQNIKHEIGI